MTRGPLAATALAAVTAASPRTRSPPRDARPRRSSRSTQGPPSAASLGGRRRARRRRRRRGMAPRARERRRVGGRGPRARRGPRVEATLSPDPGASSWVLSGGLWGATLAGLTGLAARDAESRAGRLLVGEAVGVIASMATARVLRPTQARTRWLDLGGAVGGLLGLGAGLLLFSRPSLAWPGSSPPRSSHSSPGRSRAGSSGPRRMTVDRVRARAHPRAPRGARALARRAHALGLGRNPVLIAGPGCPGHSARAPRTGVSLLSRSRECPRTGPIPSARTWPFARAALRRQGVARQIDCRCSLPRFEGRRGKGSMKTNWPVRRSVFGVVLGVGLAVGVARAQPRTRSRATSPRRRCSSVHPRTSRVPISSASPTRSSRSISASAWVSEQLLRGPAGAGHHQGQLPQRQAHADRRDPALGAGSTTTCCRPRWGSTTTASATTSSRS